MRFLFWILVLASLIGTLVVVSLLSARASGDAGMAFVLFLPACIASIVLGAGAVIVRAVRAASLTAFERRIGSGLSVLLVLATIALGVVLALD